MRRERVRRKKIQMHEKVGKSRNTVFFQWFVAQEGRKVGSLKRRVRSQLVTGAMKNCTPLWREAHFQVKRYKTPQRRTTFGSCDVEKVHAVVARSTFPSQNVQNTSASDDFWKLRCRKSARRCGAKHISKSKCTKHLSFGPLLEVEMSKKCTPLWREAHFQVKSVKNWRSRTTFGSWDVEKVSKKCTPLWREAHFEVKSVKNWGFWAFTTTTTTTTTTQQLQLELQLQQLQLQQQQQLLLLPLPLPLLLLLQQQQQQLQLQQQQQLLLLHYTTTTTTQQLQLQLQQQLQQLQLQLQIHNNYN